MAPDLMLKQSVFAEEVLNSFQTKDNSYDSLLEELT